MQIAKGTKHWIFIPLLLSIILSIFSFFFENITVISIFFISAVLMFIISILLSVFFRDPDRNIGEGIVAVADGKIKEITKIKDKDVGNCICIYTFMNVNNVHVNRMPVDGIIKDIKHISGSHLPAFKKESEKNERVITIIDTKIGKIKIIQIAGTLARRIVPYIKKGDKLKKGDKIGIIRLGSRVDVYLPIKKVSVKVGNRIKAGEDSLAKINT